MTNNHFVIFLFAFLTLSCSKGLPEFESNWPWPIVCESGDIEFETYSDSLADFSVSFPSHWLEEYQKIGDVETWGFSQPHVEVERPIQPGERLSMINVVTDRYEYDKPLKELHLMSVEKFSRDFPDLQVLRQGQALLNDSEYTWAISHITDEFGSLYSFMVMTLNNQNHLFSLSLAVYNVENYQSALTKYLCSIEGFELY